MIKNMTPHNIVIVCESNSDAIMIFEASGETIRLDVKTVQVAQIKEIEDVPITKTTYSGTILPEYKRDTYYIVSQLIKSAYPNRPDFLIPAEMVRDEKGNIIGCKSLGR